MKETSKVLLVGVFIIFYCMACKTVTTVDFENELFDLFVEKNYSFDNDVFDIYRQNNRLFFTAFKRVASEKYDEKYYELYQMSLLIYSPSPDTCDLNIDKIVLLSDDGKELFSERNIVIQAIFKKEEDTLRNDLYSYGIVLIKHLSESQLIPGNYIVKIYFNNTVFEYQFYPKVRKWPVILFIT